MKSFLHIPSCQKRRWNESVEDAFESANRKWNNGRNIVETAHHMYRYGERACLIFTWFRIRYSKWHPNNGKLKKLRGGGTGYGVRGILRAERTYGG